MSQYQITLDDALLQRLFQNDGLKPLLESLLNQVLQTQATEQLPPFPMSAPRRDRATATAIANAASPPASAR